MGLVGQQIQTRQAVRHQTYVLPQIIQGVFFLHWYPPYAIIDFVDFWEKKEKSNAKKFSK